MKPKIKTNPPGPKARAIIKRDEKLISSCLTRELPLVLEKGEGSNLFDVDGNRFLDFGSLIAVSALGHSNKEVQEAVHNQFKKLSHAAFTDFYSEVPVSYAEKMSKVLPKNLNTFFFTNSGAEAIEAAMKVARNHRAGKYFISFYNSFHGRTYGALSLTASKAIQRKGFGPYLPVIHAPYAYPYRCPFGTDDPDDCADATLAYLEDNIFKKEVPPEEVAAIFYEPIQGEGGYVVPPKKFLQGLRKLTKDTGILLVADEIQSGFYRTGSLLASENFGIVPDIVSMAKAVGGGVPLGITVADKRIMTWNVCSGAYATTFGGNLLSCAAGSAALDYVKKKNIPQKVKKDGKYTMNYLNDLMTECSLIGETRGMGMMIGIELVKNQKTKAPAVLAMNNVINRCFKRGLVLLPAGISTIRIIPPLTIERSDLDVGLEILSEELKRESKK